ncbi:MAG TPA: phosphate/phosphite/phosphonate ABC transporter substrate-binding protein, partial [Thermodesulfovibrionales bacterium]|nr:phosphate/phosphite/phosphonate ABC transporter substrate-binding protein [Thermodesulfovibrionales bacterium]
RDLSEQVSRATDEQALSSRQIVQTTEIVSGRSSQISKSLAEHKRGSESILGAIDEVKEIPAENRKRAFRIGKTLWNLQKDAELLKAEMERFSLSGERGHSLRLGVVPLQEPLVMFRKFTPLSEYLSRKLGRKVDLKVAVDMEEAVYDIGQNVTQLCAMGPANYVEAQAKYGVKVVARALRQGKAFHRAAIVVRADSGIHAVSDLKGKSFAFVSRKSATGHIAPLVTLREAGLTVKDFGYHQFLGDHDAVAKSVLEGASDAGGVMEETALKYSEKGLRVLEFSPEIPEFNICCNPSVDEETVTALRDALISLDISRADDAAVVKALGKDCTGFATAEESDYDGFRKRVHGVEAEIEADNGG